MSDTRSVFNVGVKIVLLPKKYTLDGNKTPCIIPLAIKQSTAFPQKFSPSTCLLTNVGWGGGFSFPKRCI